MSEGSEHFMQIQFKRGDAYVEKAEVDMDQLNSMLAPSKTTYTFVLWSTESLLRVGFPLRNNKGFVESGLEILFEFLTVLGVSRSGAKEYIRGFGIAQETEVWSHGQWVGFGQYLRLTLPILLED